MPNFEGCGLALTPGSHTCSTVKPSLGLPVQEWLQLAMAAAPRIPLFGRVTSEPRRIRPQAGMTPSLHDSSVPTIDLADQAAWFREALRFGLVSVREVTDWAAELVGESIAPNDSLLKLSFMSRAHPLDLVSILAGLSRDVAPLDVLPEILGVAHERVRADPAYGRHLSHALYHLYSQSDRTVPAELEDMIGFEDAYGLADCKSYGTVAEVQRDLEAFTGTFTARVGSRFKPPGR